MLQAYLVRYDEMQWNVEQRIQGQSGSSLIAKGEQQATQTVTCAKELSITHIISSDLGRAQRTAEVITQICGCDIIFDSRPRELNMGVLGMGNIDLLTEEEENRRRQLVNGTVDRRIPEGEPVQELSDRVDAALESCRDLPQGGRPLLVSHGIALGYLVNTILGLPAWAERRLRLCNCSISRVDHRENLWLTSGWVVETAGNISHLNAPALDGLQC